jgi:hypothetical protein
MGAKWSVAHIQYIVDNCTSMTPRQIHAELSMMSPDVIRTFDAVRRKVDIVKAERVLRKVRTCNPRPHVRVRGNVLTHRIW